MSSQINMDEQLRLFELLKSNDNSDVLLTDICEIKKGKVTEYTVKTNYSDVVLLISMLKDYIKMLDQMDGELIHYYKERFHIISKYLEDGIEYDYETQLNKCLHKKPEKDDRLDENFIGA